MPPATVERRTAADPFTEKALAGPLVVHAPPVGADPRPLAIVRAKSSVARAVVGGVIAVTVTGWVTLAMAPLLSVTVNTTENVPEVA